jgi:hypothetical protein
MLKSFNPKSSSGRGQYAGEARIRRAIIIMPAGEKQESTWRSFFYTATTGGTLAGDPRMKSQVSQHG